MCNNISIQGLNVILECILEGDHPGELHRSVIGQQWADDIATGIVLDA